MQHASDRIEELREIEGLREEHRRVHPRGLLATSLRAAHHDDLGVAEPAAIRVGERLPAEPRQSEIQQDDVRIVRLAGRECGRAVTRLDGRVAKIGQSRADQPPKIVVVLDEQNTRRLSYHDLVQSRPLALRRKDLLQ